MPAKVNVLIEFLAELYGTEPYWDKDLDLEQVCLGAPGRGTVPRASGQGSGSAVATR